jgi:WD40 repeat protein
MMWRTGGNYESLGTPLQRIELRPGETADHVAISAKHEMIAAAADLRKNGKMVNGGKSSAVYIWDCADGQLRHRIAPVDMIGALAFSPHGDVIAAGGYYVDGVKLWETGSGRYVRMLECDADSIAFSPDGTRLAAGSVNEISIWTTGGD